ncbi:FKBP-TYPE PEPTIDYL-PROLYL CIS-TRANS ISOMERASE FKPA [Salix koriyanagi]|uniref:peptidylprolyl isomerase n=1 Tax=Salix koriyanagi TaxID=2511006 RepID=A0A9Q1APA5_9ROSI|nr:FKBP-TYPE PEPTIDYL-PROLYL CIS-TRANS ISOMERASE FKPA [Salix koriyanagi]
MELISLFPSYHQKPTAILLSIPITKRRLANRNSNALKCRSALSSSHDDSTKPSSPSLHREGRRALIASLLSTAEAASTSRRALRASKIPESDFTTLSNGLKYYDLKVGGGPKALKGSRVAVHYVAKWKGITFMTSRQGLGVGGGTPYGFDVGQSERGAVLKGLDLGVEGMRVGGQRLLIVPPALAYGSKGVQEIPPNATIEGNSFNKI